MLSLSVFVCISMCDCVCAMRQEPFGVSPGLGV